VRRVSWTPDHVLSRRPAYVPGLDDEAPPTFPTRGVLPLRTGRNALVALSPEILARQEPLWTTPERPVVCWPLHRGDPGPYYGGRHHSHPDMEAAVVLEGQQELLYADSQLECKPGDVWFAAAGEIHGFRSEGVTNICVAFGPSFLGDTTLGEHHWLAIFAHPPGKRPRAMTAEQRSNVLGAGWQMYGEAAGKEAGWEAAIRIHLVQVLLTVARKWSPDQQLSVTAGSMAAVVPAVQMVCSRSKVGERVSTLEAADACAMSRSHFCRTFRKSMGRSFGQFELQSRLAVAARLLRSTDLPVRDIAVQAGFWDHTHLDHVFVTHYGIGPRAFRSAREVPSEGA